MNKATLTCVLCGLLAAAPLPARAATAAVTPEEAALVARNWVALILAKQGNWGPSAAPTVGAVSEMRENGRLTGFFFAVRPTGFVVVSPLRELPPVHAYSPLDDLDPAAPEGLARLLRDRMTDVLARLDRAAGGLAEAASVAERRKACEVEHWRMWEELGAGDGGPGARVAFDAGTLDYRSSKVLLTSEWTQEWPYNDQCPDLSCTNGHLHGKALVGCVPLTMAQVMRYWGWPLSFDWGNMPDELTGSSSSEQIDAVARLCHEAGEACGASYGCDGTGAQLDCFGVCPSMAGGYRSVFGFASDLGSIWRWMHDSVGWYEIIKGEINANRPVSYRIPGHNMAVDGWQEIGSTPDRMYHVNYGWGVNPSRNAWFALDGIPGGSNVEDGLLEKVRPSGSFGSSLDGAHTDPIGYFDVDGAGFTAYFTDLMFGVFLPGVKVTGVGPNFPGVRFVAAATETRLFTGEPSDMKGVRIRSGGALRLRNNGSIVLAPLGTPGYLRVNPEGGPPSRIDVSWQAGHGDQDGFEVRKRAEATGYEVTTYVTGQLHQDTSIGSGLSYTYRVRAVKRSGTASPWTREITVQAP